MDSKAGKENQFRFSTGVGPITDKIINQAFERVNTTDFKEKINTNIVDPLVQMINQRLQPYIHIGAVLYAIIVILLLVIIYLLISKKNN